MNEEGTVSFCPHELDAARQKFLSLLWRKEEEVHAYLLGRHLRRREAALVVGRAQDIVLAHLDVGRGIGRLGELIGHLVPNANYKLGSALGPDEIRTRMVKSETIRYQFEALRYQQDAVPNAKFTRTLGIWHASTEHSVAVCIVWEWSRAERSSTQFFRNMRLLAERLAGSVAQEEVILRLQSSDRRHPVDKLHHVAPKGIPATEWARDVFVEQWQRRVHGAR